MQIMTSEHALKHILYYHFRLLTHDRNKKKDPCINRKSKTGPAVATVYTSSLSALDVPL